MPQVETVLGPVDPSALGRVLMHEHIFVLTADVQQNYPEEWGSEDDRVADAVARLRELAAAGITTIVDVTVIGQGRYIPRILGVLREEGVHLSRVVLGHSGDAVRDPDYLTEMAEAGLTLGMDRFGIDHFATFQERSDLVAELCRRGLAGRMVLSHDACCHIDWFSPGSLAALKDWHYLHVSRDVLPYLRDHGVSEADIDAMLAGNPARILAG